MGRRYLQARARGVLAWLCVRPPSLERRLYEHVLGAPEAVEFDVHQLAARFGLPARSVARALFALSRHSSIAVHDAAAPVPGPGPAAVPAGMAGLEQDLLEISQARGEMMLASDDGFCIAQAGLSPQQAQRLAVQLPLGQGPAGSARVALCFGEKVLHFYASAGIELAHPRMLRLGARLLQGCQAPGATTGH